MAKDIYDRIDEDMDRMELRGRVKATVAYLTDFGRDYDMEPTRAMRAILSGAEMNDLYGRVCALIGYISGDICPTEHEKLVYEMVTGEKFERTEKPEDAGTSTGSGFGIMTNTILSPV